MTGTREPTGPWRHDTPGTPANTWRGQLARGAALGLEGVRRVVVLAAHPDDESLGAGGLVATAVRQGIRVDLVCITDGEGSHPDSASTPPPELARRRRSELRAAATALGVEESRAELLGMPDGHVRQHVGDVVAHLVELLGDGRDALVVAPWRLDGHPDHAAAGAAASAAARRTGATLWEYPIWFWHWSHPGDPTAAALRPFRVTEDVATAKRRAIAAHATQVAPLSGLPGDEAVLPPHVLDHFTDGDEHFVVTPSQQCEDDALDDLHRDHEDPWGVQSRWYEERKRALVLATLPRASFRRGLEVGCSTGALAEALAERCQELIAVDDSSYALGLARARFAGDPSVRVERADVPADWPLGAGQGCDLVVVSEVGYFLSPAALEGLVMRVRSSLQPDGVLVLCHWRHAVEGWVLDAADVHLAFLQVGMPLQATYQDRDVEIRVHAADPTWPDPER